MENLDLKQGIASPVSCSSCLSGEGRLAVGPPDPSTTLRWRNHGQGGEDSMVSDVSCSQSPSRLGWATAPSELMSLHSPSVSSTSTTSTRHFVGGLPSLIGKEVDVGLTATSSERQQSELARTRTMYDNNRPVESTFISAEVDSHHQDVINSDPLEFFSGNLHDRHVYSRNSGQVSSTVTSVVGVHHGATSGFSYRHQHKVAPAVTAALAAVATSTLCLKKFPPLTCLCLCQILADFQNF